MIIRPFLIAGLRNLMRSPLQSFITIGGLALGLTAAILAGLIIANQSGYDHFIEGHQDIVLVTVSVTVADRPLHDQYAPQHRSKQAVQAMPSPKDEQKLADPADRLAKIGSN